VPETVAAAMMIVLTIWPVSQRFAPLTQTINSAALALRFQHHLMADTKALTALPVRV
jgi:hypothetical protein